jgi:hypothetical protein
MENILFVTKVRTREGKRLARLLIDSIRTFGGELCSTMLWLFEADPKRTNCQDLENEKVRAFPLEVPSHLMAYEFGDKVFACAEAEKLAPESLHSLVWIDPTCLVIKPPVLFDLNRNFDAAVRPVHIRNVGLLSTQPLDPYWKKVCDAVGISGIDSSVETFVDQQEIHSYFNTHSFSLNPRLGLMKRWLEIFDQLVNDISFQSHFCPDEEHRVFLHQVVLSTLISNLPAERIRFLPSEYSYPYHLHGDVVPERRARSLNDLVVIAFEDSLLDPSGIKDIEIHEPLRTWLANRSKLSQQC